MLVHPQLEKSLNLAIGAVCSAWHELCRQWLVTCSSKLWCSGSATAERFSQSAEDGLRHH